MKQITLGTALAAWMLSANGSAQEPPSYTCRKTPQPPLIDGSAQDTAWDLAEVMELYDVRDLERQRQHSRPTQVRLLWDQAHLYFLFTAEDPDVWSTYDQRDAQLWQEEVVEIYIDPDGDGLNYAEIEVNPLNVVFDLLLSQPWARGGRGFAEWNPDFESAARVHGTINQEGDVDQGWTVELALPWEALGTGIRDLMGGQALPPRPGDTWRFNFYRFERLRQDGAEVTVEASAWSTVGRVDFHVPERFGFVTFAEVPTAVEKKSWGGVKQTGDGQPGY